MASEGLGKHEHSEHEAIQHTSRNALPYKPMLMRISGVPRTPASTPRELEFRPYTHCVWGRKDWLKLSTANTRPYSTRFARPYRVQPRIKAQLNVGTQPCKLWLTRTG